jgi:hypothetical protein
MTQEIKLKILRIGQDIIQIANGKHNQYQVIKIGDLMVLNTRKG